MYATSFFYTATKRVSYLTFLAEILETADQCLVINTIRKSAKSSEICVMAYLRVLRRFLTPGNNALLLCRAQSTGNAAIGIL